MDCRFGSLHYQVRGHAVALLNPLTPFVPPSGRFPCFRRRRAVKAATRRSAWRRCRRWARCSCCSSSVSLPYCLYRAPGWPFFAALVLAYVNTIAMLGLIWRRFQRRGDRRAARCSGWASAGSPACRCPSTALRKAALAFDVATDAAGAMRLATRAGERERACGELAAQLAQAMQEAGRGRRAPSPPGRARTRTSPGDRAWGGLELLAVVVFFLIGYWVVDFFWPKKKTDSEQERNPPDPENKA